MLRRIALSCAAKLPKDGAAGFKALEESAGSLQQLRWARGLNSTTTAAQQQQQAAESATEATAAAAASSATTAAGGAPPPTGFSAVPPLARILGVAGAIPFVALSPPVVSALPLLPTVLVNNAAMLQVGYGASIASFLGGIHWAMAMAGADFKGIGRVATYAATPERYLWSVTPCLMAWPAVAMQQGPGALVAASTLGLCYFVDRAYAKKGLLPPWYMSLRLPLTLLATAGLGATVYHSLQQDLAQAERYERQAAAAAAAKQQQQ